MAVGGMQGQTESREMRALTSIDSKRYPDTNKDLERNIARLNSSVDYMAQYMKLMQKGIDEANQDIIEQIQSLISNFVILFAGGTPTGIDMGDLQYIIPVLGALFGLNGPFPMSLIDAASNFFLGYVVPLPQFTDVITDVIIGWAEEIGLSDEAIQALKDFTWAVTDLGMDVIDLVTKIFGIFDIFGILPEGASMGALGTFWNALLELFEGVDTYILKPVLDAISTVAVPIINALTDIVETVDAIVEALGLLTGDVPSVGDFFGNLWNFLDFIDFSSPTFDLSAAASQFITNILSPTNLLANLVDGFIPDFRIPDLDASKIASGAFSTERVSGIQGAANIGASVQNTLDRLAQAAGNLTEGATNVDYDFLSGVFAAQQQQITEINAGLAALQADQLGQQNSGKSVTVEVGDAAEGSTPEALGFTKVAESGTQNVTVAAGAFDMGSADASTERFLFTDGVLMTDYFEVSMVMPRQAGAHWLFGPGTARSRLIGRSNSGGARFCYADIFRDKITAGAVVDGTTTQFGATTSVTVPAGAYVTFRGGTPGGVRIFQVLVNNKVKITRTDDAAVSYLGEGYRYCGFDMHTDGSYRPNTISVWGMNDNTPAPTRGVGCRVYRNKTTSVTKSSGEGVVPGGCFNIVDRITPDMAWDSATQTLTLGTEGWYMFTQRIWTATEQAESDGWWNALYLAPAGSGTFALACRGEGPPAVQITGTNPPDHDAVNNLCGGGGMVLYCHEGDQIRPGVKLNNSNTSISGDVAGVQTWFSAVLINRSLA